MTIPLAFDGDMFVLLDANGDEAATVQGPPSLPCI